MNDLIGMKPHWINTKVEFIWDGSQYVEHSVEGYWYEGEITFCANYDSSNTGANIDSAVNQIIDSSTDLNIDTNTLVVDKSADSVGIGNTVPGSMLEISKVSGSATLELSSWSATATAAHAGALKFQKSGTATVNTFTAGDHTTAGEILGRVEAYGVDDADGSTLSSYIEFANDAVSDADSSPGKIVFATSDADDAGTPTVALTIDDSQDVLMVGDLDMQDDKGIIFGTDDDNWLGFDHTGDGRLLLFKGGTRGAGTNEGKMSFSVGDSGDSEQYIVAGEGSDAGLKLYADQGDDQGDKWTLVADDGTNLQFDGGENTAGEHFVFSQAGTAYADQTWNDNTWDYAEFFEWKEDLNSDDAVKDLYGMSVVLDGDKVRVAESGEEDKILGVVRPKGSTSAHGDGLQWHGKYVKNVWGEYEEEGYTMVNWQEFLPNGNVEYRHAYPKDEIPEYRLKDGIGRDLDNWKQEENFKLDGDGEKIPVVVPSTEEEKTAANYIERTTHKSTGETLMRRKYHPDYDPSIPYVRRGDRPKEWVLIGLLGQVPVRTSAVIPDHWVKQKDLESGIDFYYIFNK